MAGWEDSGVHAGREPKAPLRVLIIGGAGAFGSQIVRRLADVPGLEIVLGGRSRARIEALAAEIHAKSPHALLKPAYVEREDGLGEVLAEHAIDIVIDAAGPFQDHDYRVAQAALHAGAHYLDLADGREFVLGFDRLDALAKRAQRAALSGVSSVPAISSAAVASLAKGLTVVEIRIGITPGAGAPFGRAVAESVLSHVGKPSERRVAGEWRQVHGWQDLKRRQLKVRKLKPLKRWLSHCEVPDLDGLARLYPTADTITFHAGIEPATLHLGLWLLSWPVRWGRVKNLSRYTDRLLALARRLGGRRARAGGMFAEVVGFDAEGKWVKRAWTLFAPPGRGPTIPAIPAALLVQEIQRNSVPYGARAAYDCLSLDMIENALDKLGISTQTAETALPVPVFTHALGADAARLAAPIRKVHQGYVPLVLEGEATVKGGASLQARLLGRLFGFPTEGDSVPVRVEIVPRGRCERWSRKFGKRRFLTTLKTAGKAGGRRVTEMFGPFAFDLRLAPDEKQLGYVLTRTRLFGIPYPRFLAPKVTASETSEDERFLFDVKIEHFLFDLIVHYRGWLVPVQHAGASLAIARDKTRPMNLADPSWPF